VLNFRCRVQPCDRELCVLGHKCIKLCFVECGPCMTPVLRQLPCGHKRELQCHVDYEKYKCQVLTHKITLTFCGLLSDGIQYANIF
jgi:hypothetical protein